MLMKIGVIIILIYLTVGCTSQQSSQQKANSPSAWSSETSESMKTDIPFSEVSPESDTQAETSNPVLSDEECNAIFIAVNEVITAYENGTIVTNDMYAPLPEEFLFPENRSLKDIDISFNEVIGDYLITMASADQKRNMVIFVNSFAFTDDAGKITGGTPKVSGVTFLE